MAPVLSVYQADAAFSRRFAPQIKRILGEHLIIEAPPEEDAHHNTDLMVLRLDAVRIACRVRRHRYLRLFGDEITIRCDRPSGTKTEFEKIVRDGWGDFLFYGFASQCETGICRWVLGDLQVFRAYVQQQIRVTGRLPGKRRVNTDGTEFLAYPIRTLPDGFVVAYSPGVAACRQLAVEMGA